MPVPKFPWRSLWLLSVAILPTLTEGGVAAAARREILPGPIEAVVLSITDGDTLLAEAHIWPGQVVRVHLRIRGIDAPELKGRCAAERSAARAARDFLEKLISDRPVAISNIGGGKYFGRVLADVETASGVPIAASLLETGLVRAYAGGNRRSWCG